MIQPSDFERVVQAVQHTFLYSVKHALEAKEEALRKAGHDGERIELGKRQAIYQLNYSTNGPDEPHLTQQIQEMTDTLHDITEHRNRLLKEVKRLKGS